MGMGATINLYKQEYNTPSLTLQSLIDTLHSYIFYIEVEEKPGK